MGAVRVTQSVNSVNDRVRKSVLALAAIGVAALLLGLVLAWFLADSLSRPLRKLGRTARQVEEGDFDARAEVSGPQEAKEVAVAFNDMADRIGTVLAAQREFVANASHQLRTPLTGLRLRLESATAKADSAELERELAAAEQEVDRLARLLNTLLMLAREGQTPRAGRLVSVGLAAKHAHERWEARADQRGQRLELEPAQDVVVHAAEEDLAIVLDNLVENALHYSPEGSSVGIEYGRDGADAFLAVLDDGPGIAPGGGDGRLRAVRARARGPCGAVRNRARPRDRADARGALGRPRRAERPARGRHEGRDPATGRRRRPDGRAAARPSRSERRPRMSRMRSALPVVAVILCGFLGAATLGYAAYIVSRDSVGDPRDEAGHAAAEPRARQARSEARGQAQAEAANGRRSAASSGRDHGRERRRSRRLARRLRRLRRRRPRRG